MKLQLSNYGKTVTYETEYEDVNLEEYFDAFKGLLVAATWSEETINKFIIEWAEELKER
jgi:hypothetical protein